MEDPTNYKYDVAISFLFRDSAMASEIQERLSRSLRVFFFPREQEELAGTDGMETMRVPFRTGSILSLVLFRRGWGETPWTRVEATAIQERCLATGWGSAFFLMLNNTDAPPRWLPETRVRFNMQDFGLEQAVGAVKQRALESGARLSDSSIRQRARLAHLETERIALQTQCFGDVRWIVSDAEPHVLGILESCQRAVAELGEVGISCRSAFQRFQFVMTNGVISVSLGWTLRYTNVMSGLRLSSHIGQLVLPGERSHYLFGGPPPIFEEREISPKLGYAGDLY